MSTRRCSRAGCGRSAVATLTYVYADSVVVVGPLATQSEPNSYDLCEHHSDGLKAPRGWEIIRIDGEPCPQTRADDLTALADAVREAAFTYEVPDPSTQPQVIRTKGHLRVLRGDDTSQSTG